jgi:hypothetical protein
MVGIVIMQRRVRSPKRFYRVRYAPFIHVYIAWSHVRGEILHDRVQSPSKNPSSTSAFLGHQLSIAVNRAQLINSQLLVHDIRFIFGPVSSPLISFLKLKARLRLKVERLPGISMLKSMEDNCISNLPFPVHCHIQGSPSIERNLQASSSLISSVVVEQVVSGDKKRRSKDMWLGGFGVIIFSDCCRRNLQAETKYAQLANTTNKELINTLTSGICCCIANSADL